MAIFALRKFLIRRSSEIGCLWLNMIIILFSRCSSKLRSSLSNGLFIIFMETSFFMREFLFNRSWRFTTIFEAFKLFPKMLSHKIILFFFWFYNKWLSRIYFLFFLFWWWRYCIQKVLILPFFFILWTFYLSILFFTITIFITTFMSISSTTCILNINSYFEALRRYIKEI